MPLTGFIQLTGDSYPEAQGKILKLPSEWPKEILFSGFNGDTKPRKSMKIDLGFPPDPATGSG